MDDGVRNSKLPVKKTRSTKDYVLAGMFIALSVVMPLYMPALLIPPFSATLASHVPIMLSMLLSPYAALVTSVGTALGFALKGVGPVIVARASTHAAFAFAGSLALKKKEWRRNVFAYAAVMLAVGFIHAALECAVVFAMTETVPFEVLFVTGLGTFIHHCIDASITYTVYTVLCKAKLMD